MHLDCCVAACQGEAPFSIRIVFGSKCVARVRSHIATVPNSLTGPQSKRSKEPAHILADEAGSSRHKAKQRNPQRASAVDQMQLQVKPLHVLPC